MRNQTSFQEKITEGNIREGSPAQDLTCSRQSAHGMRLTMIRGGPSTGSCKQWPEGVVACTSRGARHGDLEVTYVQDSEFVHWHLLGRSRAEDCSTRVAIRRGTPVFRGLFFLLARHRASQWNLTVTRFHNGASEGALSPFAENGDSLRDILYIAYGV